jgi:hypothetical protein
MNKYGRIASEPNDPQVRKCRAEFFAKSEHKIRSRRGVSLFERIASRRTCRDAMVPFEYCNCRHQTDLTNDESTFIKGEKVKFSQTAILLVEKINVLTDKVRSLCEPFKLVSVHAVRSYIYNGDKIYFFHVSTEPGEAMFDAYFTMPNSTSIELVGKIIRSSRYGNQSACVDEYEQYKEYCFCKNKS